MRPHYCSVAFWSYEPERSSEHIKSQGVRIVGNFLCLGFFIFSLASILSGCSMLTIQDREEGVRKTKETSETEKSKVEEKGSPPLISKKTEYHIQSEGAVTIIPAEEKSDSDVLTEKILNALSTIQNQRNSDQSFTFEQTVEMEMYKKMSYFGGACIIAVGIGLLLTMRALSQLRSETEKWGFDPKIVGYSANKMFKWMTEAQDLLTREKSSLVNLSTSNNLSDDVHGQVNRQLMKLKEIKDIMDKIETIPRSASR